ncbi:hypothetical protein U1Q18_008063 [Sarracenia purpurea var. burkii]
MSLESGKALKELASAIKTMTHPSSTDEHIENSRKTEADLKIALETTSREKPELLEIIPAITVASILTDIIKATEEIVGSVRELSHQAHFKSVVEATVLPEKPPLNRRGSVKPFSDDYGDGDSDSGGDHVTIMVHGTSPESPKNEIPQAPKEGKI